MVGDGACANLRSLAVLLGGCANACVSFFLARWLGAAANGRKRSLRYNLRSLAVPLAGQLRERLREFFLGSLCYTGGCKWSETELALIYVRSLCRGAVARTLV